MNGAVPRLTRDRRNWLIALVVLGIALGYSTLVHLSCPVYPEDDAFIIYRYVENIVAGHGPVYNVGQRVFGASCPLYVAGLALAKLVLRSVPTPNLAVRLNFLPWLLVGVGLFLLLRRLLEQDLVAALFAAFFLVRDDLLRISTGGMESSFFAALLVWALWALVRHRFRLAAWLAGISVLVRLEGVLLLLVVFGAWLVLDRQRPLGVLLGLLLPGLAWTVFGFAYYGTPVYHSIIAKAKPLYPLPPAHAFLAILREFDARILGNLQPYKADGMPVVWRFTAKTAVLILLTGVGLWGQLRLLFRCPATARGIVVLTAVPLLLLLLLIFYLASNPLLFPWYLPPLYLLWFIVVAGGGHSTAQPRARRLLVSVLGIFFAVVTLRQPLERTLTGRSFIDIGITQDPVRTRIEAYREAAEWLNRVLPSGTPVLAAEIGSFGYYYQGPVIDGCGLVTPEALPYMPVPLSERYSAECGTIPLEFVKATMPDVICTMATFAGLSLFDDDWFKLNYQWVRAFNLPKPAWNTPAVDVYIRRDHL